MKCVLLFSDKSSGSSALQRALVKHPDLNTVEKTRHFYSETLYWNKAAALLGMEQAEMRYSELPMSQDKARTDLYAVLRDNLPDWKPSSDDSHTVFEGWRLLCEHYAPIFFEKSPHHLHYTSALELIRQFDNSNLEIDFRYIGLVRNPIDTLYSMWQRWSAIPEKSQYEWLRAHRNMLEFQQEVGEQLLIIRYEDLTAGPEVIQQLCNFIGIEWNKDIGSSLHRKSVQKWRNDRNFGFQPSKEVVEMAVKLGYKIEEVTVPKSPIWPVLRLVNQANFHVSSGFNTLKKSLRGR
ncbi:MAG: sulfotransferase [Calditrichota bacterium]